MSFHLFASFSGESFQPSIIDGYRTAVADKFWNTNLNISKDKLSRLLDSLN